MSKTYPHVPAAFINAIADEGTKKEAVEWLQKTWNELCAVTAERDELIAALREIHDMIKGSLPFTALIKDMAGAAIAKHAPKVTA